MFGTIETKQTGRSRKILNADWPICHVLGRAGWGWYVSLDVCDKTADEVREFASETEARQYFDTLDGILEVV